MVVFLALLAAGSGTYWQFVVEPKVQKCELLNALMHELAKCLHLFKEFYMTVPEDEDKVKLLDTPTFPTDVADRCVSEAVLDPQDDRSAFQALQHYHEIVRQINANIMGQQTAISTQSITWSDVRYRRQALIKGGRMRQFRTSLNALSKELFTEKYVSMHGVSQGAYLFDDPP